MSANSQNETAALVVSPKEARRMLGGVSQDYFYKHLVHQLDSYHEGRCRKITVASIHKLIARRLEAAKTGKAA